MKDDCFGPEEIVPKLSKITPPKVIVCFVEDIGTILTNIHSCFVIDIGLISMLLEILLNGSSSLFGARLAL